MKGTAKLKSEKQQTTYSFNCFVLFCSARFLVRVSFFLFFFFLFFFFSFLFFFFFLRMLCSVCFVAYALLCLFLPCVFFCVCFLPAYLLIPDASFCGFCAACFLLRVSFHMFSRVCFVPYVLLCVFCTGCFALRVLFSMFCSACFVPDILFQSGQPPPPSPPAVPMERCQPTPLSAARAPPALWDSRKVV